MNVNLEKEIFLLQQKLLDIDNEHESYFKKIFLNSSDNISLNGSKVKDRVYICYPYLFYNEFQNVQNKDFRKISFSSYLHLKNILLNDTLIDSNELVDPTSLFYSNYLLRKCFNTLNSIFNSSSIFWDYFSIYEKEYTSAVLLERAKHFGVISTYPYTEFEVIGKGKAAMAKYVTTALAILNNTPEKIESLEKSQDYFSIAYQLFDDLVDWKQDYVNKNYSYFLTNIIHENQIVEQVNSNNPPDIETIGRLIYLSEFGVKQLSMSIHNFQKAADYAANCTLWVKKINELVFTCQQKINNFITIRSKLLSDTGKFKLSKVANRKVSNTTNKENLFNSIKQSLNYVLTQRKLGYSEMQHNMSFTQTNIIVSGKIHQTGINFQRALVTDTLIDAHKFLPHNSYEIISSEVESIIADKLDRVRGGWSYFSGLPEMPPDADSLGQVIQVLMRSKHKDTVNLLSDPISLLLSDCRYYDGTFETWMVDNKDSSKETRIIKNAIKKGWKFQKGKDNDVQANILYGLFLYDYEKYKVIIEKGVNTLEKRIEAPGYWKSIWYFGNYYGTYVATRVMKSVKPKSKTLKRVGEFLLNNQNYDGGWGTIGSDPLNTSFALLTLVLLDSKYLESISKGLRYLLTKQNSKGYWNRIEFFKMDRIYTTRIFKSKTITTQFCIKALVAISSHVNLVKILGQQIEDCRYPKPKVYPIYQSLKNTLYNKDIYDAKTKSKLINSKYIIANKNLFTSIPSINKSRVLKNITSFRKDSIYSLIQKIENDNIIEICQESIAKCFKKLPLNKMPETNLWIGDYSFLSENTFIGDIPTITISLEFFSDSQLSKRKNNKQKYYNKRLYDLKNSIPIIVANQYADLVLKQLNILNNSVYDKLFNVGYAAYFSKETFSQYELSSHLFFTEVELRWCMKNEWFIKREIKSFLKSTQKKDVERYFSINSQKSNQWFPNRLGYFVGYRVIEEYLKNRFVSTTFRELVSENSIETILKSRYF